MKKSVEVKSRGFDNGFPPLIVDHHFSASAKGELLHAIDGVPRAVVPAESFAHYVEQYPACKPVVDAITGRPAKSTNTAAASKAKAAKKKK